MPSRSTVLLAQTAHWAVWLDGCGAAKRSGASPEGETRLVGTARSPGAAGISLKAPYCAAAAPGGDDLRGGNALMLPWWRRFLLGGLGGWRTARPMRSRGSRRRGRFPGAEPVRGPASRGYGGRGRPPCASRVVVEAPHAAQQRVARVRARGVRDEEGQQRVLEVGEVERLAGHGDLVGCQVHRHVLHDEAVGRGGLVAGATAAGRMRAAHSSGERRSSSRSLLFTCTGRRKRASWPSPTMTRSDAVPSSSSSASMPATSSEAPPRASYTTRSHAGCARAAS